MSDRAFIEKGIREIENFANDSHFSQSFENEDASHLTFRFGQSSGKAFTKFSFEYLCGLLSSSNPLADLLRNNPFFDTDKCHLLLDSLSSILVRTNRVSQINRCISSSIQLSNSITSFLVKGYVITILNI
jgi:hypothetical protein